MKIPFDPGVSRRGIQVGCMLVALALAAPVQAAADVSLWHSLQGHNADVLQSLARNYNRSQSDVRVQLRQFDTPEALLGALDSAARSKSLPALAQIGSSQVLEDVAQRDYVQPFYQVEKLAPLRNVHWFVASDNAFIHDPRGRLLAFPYLLEVPVMYYNQDAFKKAGLAPAQPQRTWMNLQGQLVELANHGSRQCPLTSDLPVSINLENLAAVNNQLYASAENGLKAKGLPSFSFDSTYVRHLSLMISWVRAQIMVKPAAGRHPISRFASGECAVLMSSSGHIGTFSSQRGLHYGVSGLPYYPEVTRHPGNPFISGSGLWVMKSPQATTAATARFLAWLAQPAQASRWYQETGFLPLTKEAFQATPASYYANLGSWRDLVAVYASPAAVTGRGFRINNYPAIRARFHQILDTALEGKEPAVTALSSAAAEGNQLVRQRAAR